MKINEENFIQYLKRRDERGLDYVVDEYGGLVKSVIGKYLYGFPHLQEECMNDVLLAVWEHIEEFNPEKNSFKNWIAAIGKYKSIDYKRKHSKRLEEGELNDYDIESGDKLEDEVFARQLSEEIEELMAHLSPGDRELFMDHYLGDRSIVELSEDRGVSRTVIDNRLSRGRKKLRNIWNQK